MLSLKRRTRRKDENVKMFQINTLQRKLVLKDNVILIHKHTHTHTYTYTLILKRQ